MMWRCAVGCFILLIISLNLTQTQEGLTAILSPIRDRISSKSIIRNFERIPTAGLCFNMCRHDDSCLSFFFHTEEQFCQIHSVVFQQDSFWEDRNGTAYYRRLFRNACDSLDYVYHPPTNTCYKIYYDIMLAQPEALLHCQQDGGSLISLQTFDKFWHIRDAVMTFPQFYDISATVVIGAIERDTSWHWMTGEIFPLTSPIWFKGRPKANNSARIYAGFKRQFKFYIIDAMQAAERYFICETNARV